MTKCICRRRARHPHLQMNTASLHGNFLPFEPFARLSPTDIVTHTAADIRIGLDPYAAIAIKIRFSIAASRAAKCIARLRFKS